MKPTQKTDAELKAEFIARKGVTIIPPVNQLPIAADDPAKKFWPRARNPLKPSKPRPMPTPAPLADRGEKPEMIWVCVDELHINDAYQREISTRRGEAIIRDIVANFRWALFQPLNISTRDEGGYWVIDGQHRLAGAREAGEKLVPAILQRGLTMAAQARTFAGINGKRVTMHALALHHAMVAAGDPVSVAIHDVCERAGVSIPRYPKQADRMLPNETMCVSTLKEKLKTYGADNLVAALQSIRRAAPDTPGMMTRESINARLERIKRSSY